MTGGPSSRDRLGDYSTDRPILLLTSMAAAVGVISAFVALALVRLIGLFTNLAYFHRFATSLTPPAASGLGLWAVPIPVIGGVIVGLMARYGSDRIRGHGIPEALEAILIGRSRMDPKVAVLKPLSSAIAIGTGGPYGAEGPIIVTSLGLGLAAGLGATAITPLLYGCEDLFARLPIHWMWWPAIGGLFVGLGGLIAPRALGVGYDVIHDLLAGRLLGATLVALLLVKAAIWAIGLGSGTSGGLVAPLLLMGSALGALGATVFHAADPGLWAMIGMAALMGGTMQIPVTAIVFALELTGDVAA